jgi:hypothetical protein
MGADSLSSDHDLRVGVTSPKVARFGEFLIGFAGSWGTGQGLLAMLRAEKVQTLKQLGRDFTISADVDVLVADRNGVYEFMPGGVLVKMRARKGVSYGVAGTGAGPALGSLYSWHDGRDALLSALGAAEAHTNHARRPFKVLSL